MPPRWVHFRVDEELYERMHAEAAADRRSLSNWLSLSIEDYLSFFISRVPEETPPEQGERSSP